MLGSANGLEGINGGSAGAYCGESGGSEAQPASVVVRFYDQVHHVASVADEPCLADDCRGILQVRTADQTGADGPRPEPSIVRDAGRGRKGIMFGTGRVDKEAFPKTLHPKRGEGP